MQIIAKNRYITAMILIYTNVMAISRLLTPRRCSCASHDTAFGQAILFHIPSCVQRMPYQETLRFAAQPSRRHLTSLNVFLPVILFHIKMAFSTVIFLLTDDSL